MDYRNEAFNKFRRQSINYTCSSSRTSTLTFTVSASVEAEAGVIFAKAKVTAGVSFAKSVSTTDAAAGSFKLRPRRWAHCTRGITRYDITGNVRTQFKKTRHGQISWWRGTYENFSGKVPSHDFFTYGPGRLRG